MAIKKQVETLSLWAFYYNPMIWESAAYIVSYHKTRQGAVKAMNDYQKNENQNSGSYTRCSVEKLELEILD